MTNDFVIFYLVLAQNSYKTYRKHGILVIGF